MIKSIRLVNWRSHSDTKLAFHKGTNLLVGIMGAGKSSILEAFSFALFGVFPAIERRKLKIENIVRLNEPNALVVLEFEWNNALYRVERTIDRAKKSGAEIYKDNSLAEHGQSAVTSYVQNLLGVDYDLFARAIYSEQNNIDHFLNLDPRRRREELDALLGLDRFESARTNVVTVTNYMRSKRQGLEEKFSRDEARELESSGKKHSEAVALAESKLNESASLHAQKSKELSTASAAFESMKKEKEAFDALDRELLQLSGQYESLKKEFEGKTADQDAQSKLEKKSNALEAEHLKFLTQLKTQDARHSGLSKEMGSIEAKLKADAQNQATLAALDAELKGLLGGETAESLAAKQKEAEQSLLALESEKKSIEHEMAEIGELVPKLKPGLSKCPLCSSELSEVSIAHIKAEKDAALKTRSARLSELESLLKAAKKTSEDVCSRNRRSALAMEKLASLKAESADAGALTKAKKNLEEELASAQDEKLLLQTAMENLNSDLEAVHQELAAIKKLLMRKAEFDATEARIKGAKTKLSGVKFDAASFEVIRSKAEQLRLESERLSASRKTAEAELLAAGNMLKMVRERLASIKSTEKEISSLAKLEEELCIYKNALLDTQTGLRLSLIEAINSAMNEIWPIFYPYKNYGALRLGVSEKDYIFEVDDGSGWKGLEAMASGGERACAALALRVALAMVLTPNLGWLILDEPTHNLDSEAVEMLSSALQYKVPEVVKQIFIITHDEAFMGSEFASSYRLTRDKSRNGETKVEAM